MTASSEDCAPPFSASRFFLVAIAGYPEPQVVTEEARNVRAARRCAQAVEPRFPASAAMHSFLPGFRTTRINLWGASIGFKVIQAPFPDIARHVFHAKWAGSQRERAYG